MEKDLTQLQIKSLPEVFNLSDGHAHRRPNSGEQQIINSMVQTFDAAERERQREIEHGYVDAFFKLHQQSFNHDKTKFLILSSASLSLEVIANYVRLSGLDLALIEPCFDNLPNMFKRHNVPLEPFPDTYLELDVPAFRQRLNEIKSKAIALVSPNNPTGIMYTEANFRELVAFCKERQRLLIVDSSFRAYKPDEAKFDEYDILQQSGIDYIMVEDSGKTWPTKELKVSILAMPAHMYRPVFDIYTDLFYHCSPFVIQLLTEFVRNSDADHLQGVKEVIAQNRKCLYDTVRGTILTPSEKPLNSMAWLRVSDGYTARQVDAAMRANGLFALPGRMFFWTMGNTEGDRYIRIALPRDTDLFARAMQRLSGILQSIAAAEKPAATQPAASQPVLTAPGQ